MNEWQSMRDRPRKSGFYAIDDGGLSRKPRYAAFNAQSGQWSELQSDLSALAGSLDELKSDLSDCDGWRELTPKEAGQVTSSMLDWAEAVGRTVSRPPPRRHQPEE